jgi:hypothetical protein
MNPSQRRNEMTCRSRPAWLLRLIGAGSGMLIAACACHASAAWAESGNFRAAAAAPSSWREFATRLQRRFQERLAADTGSARRFQDDMAKRAAKPDAPRFVLNLRTWIEPDGKIARVECDAFDDDRDAADNLRALLSIDDVGAPPPDMLQPLRLRLSLRPKEQPSRAE